MVHNVPALYLPCYVTFKNLLLYMKGLIINDRVSLSGGIINHAFYVCGI